MGKPGLFIHTAGWVQTAVAMQTDGSFTHLVVVWDMDLMNCTQYADVVNKLTHSLKVLEKSKSSTHIKLKSLELVTYNQIVYDTKFAMWPLSMYQKLDKIVTTSIKVITKNMVSYPTSVVYMNEQSMGLGIKQLSIVI